MEDVRREHDPDRQRRNEDERGQAVVAGPPVTRGELPDRRSKRAADGERAKRSGEPKPARQDKSRKRSRRNGMGKEREPTKHDPSAEEPARDGKQKHLNDTVLDERKRKRLEHRRE